MTVLHNRDTGDMSNAVVEDGYVVEYSKNPPPARATWIDYGFFVVRKRAIMGTADADLAPLLSRLAGRGDIRAYAVGEPFHEIGTPEALRATEDWIRSGVGNRLFPDA